MTSSDFVNRPFGDYHIYRHLGGGAMADVFLAEQRSLGRRVALKILKRELASDEMNVRRFTHEARAVARMTHPNIVHVYEVGWQDGLHFIVQEYVPGSNLLQLIEKHGALGVDQVVHILRSTAAALEKASREGIVHRDIKPENILISEIGEVKVADFGLARVLDPDTDVGTSPALTQAGMTVGTPLYMSPEQAQGRPLDLRSDMYSLGITCYHALAGHPPFQGETSLSVALAHVNTPPKPLEQIRQDIPPPLARIVHRMIAKKPEQRYPSFLDLRQDLQVLQSQYPPEFSGGNEESVWNDAAFESGRNPLAEATTRLGGLMRQESRSRFHLGRFILFFLAAFLLTAVGTVLWSRYQPPILSAQETLTVPRKHNVAEQWIYACRQRSDEPQRLQAAWWAVAQYFPEAHPIWEIKAKRQIARIDYQYHNPVGAIPIFQEFADMSDAWPEYRIFGLAGLAWCYANAGKYDTAISALHECLFVGSELESFDSLTRQLFEATLRLLPEAPSAIRNVPEEMSDGESEPEPIVPPPSGTSDLEDATRSEPADETPQPEAGFRKPPSRRGAGQPFPSRRS